MRSHLYVTDLTSNLYTVDPATGSAGLVGPTGMASITDIAFHGPTLYGVTFSRLVRLNPETGAAVAVGAPFSYSTNGLAVSEEGTIYAGTTGASGQLITINPVTGAATLVGLFGGGMTSSGDLVFDDNGILYGALNQGANVVLAKINRTTGVATVIGPMGFNNVYGLAIHCCRFFGGTSAGELLSLNAATGQGILIGKNTVSMGGMSARPCCC
jgi:outer membrane protein assembly factor BamB